MKLNKKEIKILIEWGYTEKNIQQIQNLKYELKLINLKNLQTRKISMKEAKDKLGIGYFLSGIARSAFHLTAFRKASDEEGILIESSLYD